MFVTYDTVTKLIRNHHETLGGAKRTLTCARKREAKRNAARTGPYDRPTNYYANYEIVTLEWYNANVRCTKKVRNLLNPNGPEIEIDINTPACNDPSTETYHCM